MISALNPRSPVAVRATRCRQRQLPGATEKSRSAHVETHGLKLDTEPTRNDEGSLGGTSSILERASERHARGCSCCRTDWCSTFQPAWLKIDAAAYGSSEMPGKHSRLQTQAVALLLTLPQLSRTGVRRGAGVLDQIGNVADTASTAPPRATAVTSASEDAQSCAGG